jgi:sec-independent protein translocase protein TatA
MPRLGMGELLVILLIVVVLFGANKLPALGAGLGQGIKSFKKAISGGDDDKPAPGQAGAEQSPPKQDPKV